MRLMVASGGSRTPYLHLMRVVRYRFSTPQWCQWVDLNHRPLAYEASVLYLLNYTGIIRKKRRFAYIKGTFVRTH